MWEWFRAGGSGMFMVLAVGVAGLGYGVKTLLDPIAERLRILGAVPGLIVSLSLFSFGVNMWAVNLALEKLGGASNPSLPAIGFVGVTEAVQTVTLGGLLAALVGALHLVARSRARATE